MLHVCQSHITQVYLFCSKFMNVHHYHIKITIIITTIIILVIIKFELDSNLKHIMFIFQLNYYYNYRNPLQHSGNGWIKIWTCFNLPIENYNLIWCFSPFQIIIHHHVPRVIPLLIGRIIIIIIPWCPRIIPFSLSCSHYYIYILLMIDY